MFKVNDFLSLVLLLFPDQLPPPPHLPLARLLLDLLRLLLLLLGLAAVAKDDLSRLGLVDLWIICGWIVYQCSCETVH